MRKKFTAVFVTRPIGFILFLCLGVIGFLMVSVTVKIPLYQTMDASIAKEGEKAVLRIGDMDFLSDRPIYVYESREDHLEKIEDYERRPGKIVLNGDIAEWKSGSGVKVDVQLGEKSLLEIIFQNGGNI